MKARIRSLQVLAWALALGLDTAQAHDFWLQPAEFWPKPDSDVPFTVQVGHGPFRQRSPIRSSRIVRLSASAPDGSTIDLRTSLHMGGAAEDGTFRLRAPGDYVLVLQTDDSAQSHLPAAKFNDYLHTEGLTEALEQRERERRMDADGSESYSRVAKSIVHIGLAGASPSVVTRPSGLRLEIVPQISPYALPRARVLPARVIYEGQPLAGALVKLTDLANDSAPLESEISDPQGQVRFSMPGSGAWLLSVIWSRPRTDSRETDFETVFSSLSFGLP